MDMTLCVWETIADRVGHGSIDITCRYVRVFPSPQQEAADKLGKSC